MIDAHEWLEHAAALALQTSETALRRSVSTSYYAAFHAIAGAAVDAFGARSGSSRARLIHRGLSHERLRLISAETLKSTPGREVAPFWPPTGFGADCRRLANAVLDLQQARHAADYDPDLNLRAAEVGEIVATAGAALGALRAVPADERDLWLTLILVRPPGRA